MNDIHSLETLNIDDLIKIQENYTPNELGDFFTILCSNDSSKIEQTIQQRMIDNFTFFESNFPQLYAGLCQSPQEYNLLFDEKGLNIINIRNQALMFPEVDGQYTMVSGAMHLTENPLTHPQWTLYTNDLKISYLSKKQFPMTSKLYNSICYAAIPFGILKEGMHLPNDFLPTVTLLGLGGGLVLEALRERYTKIHALLIFEESLDLFRISCYFVDYPALFEQVNNRSCFLFVESLMKATYITTFFDNKKITANYLRLELMLYDTPKLKAVQNVINGAYAKNARGWGTFDDELTGIENALKNMEYTKTSKGHFTLKHPFFFNTKRINAPICVVGNGPSLNNLLPFIKENAQKMIIFSCGTAIKPLLNYGIKPDFQFEIERTDYLHTAFDGLELSGITLICANLVDSKVLELFDEALIFSRDGSCAAEIHAPKNRLLGASPFVGNAATSLAAMVGSDVLFCGVDCGYILGATKHAEGSFYGAEQSYNEEKELPKDSFRVKPNKDKIVFADSLFFNSKDNIEGILKIFRPNTVLNLGEGAYIEGALSVNADNFSLKKIDKKVAIKRLKRFFSKQSEQAFHNPIEQFFEDKGDVFFSVLEKIFDEKVDTKQELFTFLDNASLGLMYAKNISPYWSTLMSGSIMFYLQIVMLCALAMPTNDIADFMTQAKIIFKRELKNFQKKHNTLIARYQPNKN